MNDTVILSSAVAGITTGVVSTLLNWFVNKPTRDRVTKLEEERVVGLENRLGDVERKHADHAQRDQGEMMSRDLERFRTRLGGHEDMTRGLGEKMAGVMEALKNQARTFRDMSGKMERFVEETTRQGERIENNKNRLDGVHSALRRHTDDRGLHGNG